MINLGSVFASNMVFRVIMWVGIGLLVVCAVLYFYGIVKEGTSKGIIARVGFWGCVVVMVALLVGDISWSIIHPKMEEVVSMVEHATGVTDLECKGDSHALEKGNTECTFKYKGEMYSGHLIIDKNHIATLYKSTVETPIPVLKK